MACAVSWGLPNKIISVVMFLYLRWNSARELKTLQPSKAPRGGGRRPLASCWPSSPPPATKSRRFLEFCAVTIENPNIRKAYFRACRRLFAWCERKKLDELIAIGASMLPPIAAPSATTSKRPPSSSNSPRLRFAHRPAVNRILNIRTNGKVNYPVP